MIERKRACLCCDGAEKLISVSQLIYAKKSQGVKATMRVVICESCFVLAITGDSRNEEHRKLSLALFERLRTVYNAMTNDSRSNSECS